MESEARIREARKVMRAFITRGTQRNGRVHDNAQDDTQNRMRALDGICGQCEFLQLYFDRQHGKEVVRLACNAGKSPLDLYRNTEMGQTATCDGYNKK
jgi:hypothetical protein